MSDLDLIYGGGKKPSPAKPQQEEKPKEEILTNKQVSNKASKQVSTKVIKEESKETSIEARILALLQTTDLKANTFRYTQEELDFIRDVAYEAEVKYKTKLDKNDVARIGLEWLMEDWKANKEASLLARILTSKQIRK